MTQEEPTRIIKRRASRGLYVPYLKAWRLYLGYGVRETGRLASINPSNLCAYEKDSLRPTPLIISRIAAAYGISRETLINVDPASVEVQQIAIERTKKELHKKSRYHQTSFGSPTSEYQSAQSA